MTLAASFEFLKEFLHRPGELGTFAPSSRFLESRIVRVGRLHDDATVIELGPGLGGTTAAILRELPPTARLIAIELNSDFIRPLKALADPRLIVHEGRAEDLSDILDQYGLATADVVYSGIPFSAISADVGESILSSIWSTLSPGGRFIAYQLRSNVKRLARDLMGDPDIEFELFNIPPLWVYRWQKALEFAAQPAELLNRGFAPA